MNERTTRQREQGRQRGGICLHEDHWLFVCEGEDTEPNYLNSLYQTLKEKNKHTPSFECKGGQGTNVKLVTKAISHLANLRGSKPALTFVVFDNDSKDCDALFNKAVRMCVENKLIPLWTNKCFELWLLLHVCDCQIAYTPQDYCDKLSEYFKQKEIAEKYDKTHPAIYEQINRHGSIGKAKQRANKLMEGHSNKQQFHQKNPGTSMCCLFNEIDQYHKEKERRPIDNR